MAEAIFGNESGTNGYTESSLFLGSKYENTAGTGNVTKLEIYFDSGVAPANVAIAFYADNAGAVGAKLGGGTVAGVAGWTALTGLSIPVTQGAYYWICWSPSEAANVRYDTEVGTNFLCYGGSGYYNPMPDTPPSLTYNNSQYVLRATVELGGALSIPVRNSILMAGIPFAAGVERGRW